MLIYNYKSIIHFVFIFIGAVVTLTISLDAKAIEEDLLLESDTIVMTPTRLRQPLKDVPASVTVITAKMLKDFGIMSIPDALRMVPGMAITQLSGNDFRINYHGTNALLPRRMNVLIDGVPAYRPAVSMARVDWYELPVNIDDIQRIEVTRSSNSATYGSNSMLAIINIITKTPEEVKGTTITAHVGSLNTKYWSARYAGNIDEQTSYRISFSQEGDSGYDYISTFGDGHNRSHLNKFNFRSNTKLTSDQSLDLSASFVDGVKEVGYIDKFQKTFPDAHISDYSINAIWKNSFSTDHELQVQAYLTEHQNNQDWITCPPTATFLPQLGDLWKANANYALTVLAGRVPTGGSAQDNTLVAAAIAAIKQLGSQASQPVCVNGNQNFTERRMSVELQDTYVFSDKLRMVNGAGIRQDMGKSQTFLDGEVANNSVNAFSNIEYKPTQSINLNLGGFLETDQITGTTFSPRGAINWHLSANHTLRFILSKAYRMPDILEQKANWSYRTNFPTPINGMSQGSFFQTAISPGNLTSEKIFSKEIGYFGNLPEYGLLIDVKIFEDRLSDLISEKLQLSEFLPTNNNWVNLKGAELQINYAPNEKWYGFLTYAYLKNEASTILEQTQSAGQIGSIGFTYALLDRWRATFAYYGNSGGLIDQTYYGREDVRIEKTIYMSNKTGITASLTARHLNNRTSTQFIDYGNSRVSRYADSMQYFSELQVTF